MIYRASEPLEPIDPLKDAQLHSRIQKFWEYIQSFQGERWPDDICSAEHEVFLELEAEYRRLFKEFIS
jgi:hypothetical protein